MNRSALFSQLHPAIVHFPIALYFMEFFLLVLSSGTGDEAYRRFSAVSFRFAYVFMLAALVSGYVAAGGWKNLNGATGWHFYAAVTVFLFYSVRAAAMRLTDASSRRFAFLQVAGSVMGCALIAATAYLGGRLVYS